MISLETLVDNSPSARNFAKLAQATIDTGGDPTTGGPRSVGMRFGTVSFTWPGATAQQTIVINHGLGAAPVVVLAINSNNNTAGLPRTFTYTATQFTLNIIAPANVTVGTGDTYRWVAIG